MSQTVTTYVDLTTDTDSRSGLITTTEVTIRLVTRDDSVTDPDFAPLIAKDTLPLSVIRDLKAWLNL